VIRYKDISATVRRFIAAHEAYRKMGFSADDIYAEPAIDGLTMRLSCFALLRTQGKEFRVCCGPIDNHPAWEEEHRRVTTAIAAKEVSQTDLDRIWRESEVHLRPGLMVAAIVAKGILPPGPPPN